MSVLFSMAFALDTGDVAPGFELHDLEGNLYQLEDTSGKIVVLEWFNPDCPYVKYAYNNTELSQIQKKYHGKKDLFKKTHIKEKNVVTTERNTDTESDTVVWFAINSGYPGKQGTDKVRNEEAQQAWNIEHPILLDPTGYVGKLYNAQTTPQFVIIDSDGKIQYQGGLDNAPMGKLRGKEKQNYIENALFELTTHQAISVHKTKPYGCSIKYQ